MEFKEPSGSSFREQQRVHIEKTLSYYLKNLDNGRLPRENDDTLNVLSVGCGLGFDAKPIVDIFSGSVYKGIDNDPSLISNAKKLNADVDERAQFEVEDATEAPLSEDGKYGLVLIRHPQVLGETIIGGEAALPGTVETWRSIIKASVKKTKKQGYIFASAMSVEENEKIVQYLEENGVEVLISLENGVKEDAKGLPFKDTYVMVGKRT